MISKYTASIITTKLNPPSLPPKRVARPQLLNHLNHGLDTGRQITLVSAPAGFGKTVCAGEWVEQLELPVAWLSLDAADEDPGRFFSYLVAALQNVDENLGWEIEGILRAGRLPPEEIISTTLINDIQAMDERFVLVLDDFQVIQDDRILGVLEQLLTHLPNKLHLVLLTREDPNLPLARLRANNQLNEVRAQELRFSFDEAGRFLREVMALPLSQSDIQAIEMRTEGWIAGLLLTGLILQNREDPSTVITNLSGGHRFILSYFSEEVLNRQPQDVQDFLLQTSILERLNGDLCNTVTGRSDSLELLEQLYHANLFLIPLDDEGHWYRFHQLFVDLLRDLQTTRHKDAIPGLHQRACDWYSQAGFISEAIQHALAAEDYPTAVKMIESHAMDMLMQWHLKTVDGWMRSIPAEWIAQSPQANLAFAWMHLMRPDFPQASPYLERLQVMFSDPKLASQDPALLARWLALQAMMLNAQGQAMECLELCNQALELIPEGDDHVRNMIYLELAKAYEQFDDYDNAVETYQRIIRAGQTTGNSVAELLGISALALLALKHGQLHFAYEIITAGIERIERAGALPPVSTAVYGELGVIHYQWHQMEKAHHYFQRAIQVSTLSGYSDAELFYGVILSRLYQIEGDLERAAEEIHKAVNLMKVQVPAAVREEIIAQEIRINLAQDHLVVAESSLKRLGSSFKDRLILTPHAPIQNISALRILLYRAQIRAETVSLKQGIELADQLVDSMMEKGYIMVAIETLLLRAQLHTALGDDQESAADFLTALQLGEPEGFISIFIEEGPPIENFLVKLLQEDLLESVSKEYVRNILAAFTSRERPSEGPAAPASQAEPGEQLIESLTERELEVLRLIARGLKYKDIGERLYISLNTVRYHVKSIYGKLNVNNRTTAIEKAHQLGIL